ncbi:hypothetical protein K458DRAFT_461932 [Lentithecium fluviatile CBS 122367]|uniref:Uncharacterized protein n=1 Tax=Lentithecium fluviatile CBS 122367 TaxID=1168545 RepID=A0A6G1JF37_9PLEO|nr:hypothetical protein K458DRAFT_461932 [Lentithecium fluviatile CBS 122367]
MTHKPKNPKKKSTKTQASKSPASAPSSPELCFIIILRGESIAHSSQCLLQHSAHPYRRVPSHSKPVDSFKSRIGHRWAPGATTTVLILNVSRSEGTKRRDPDKRGIQATMRQTPAWWRDIGGVRDAVAADAVQVVELATKDNKSIEGMIRNVWGRLDGLQGWEGLGDIPGNGVRKGGVKDVRVGGTWRGEELDDAQCEEEEDVAQSEEEVDNTQSEEEADYVQNEEEADYVQNEEESDEATQSEDDGPGKEEEESAESMDIN